MNHEAEHNQTPADLRAIEAAVERLARSERAAAPASLEHDLADCYQSHNAFEPIPIVRRSAPLARLRIAAALLLAGSLALVIGLRLNARSTPFAPSETVASAASPTLLEEDIELWLTLRSPDEFQGVSDRIDVLYAETQAIDSSLSSDWDSLLDSSM